MKLLIYTNRHFLGRPEKKMLELARFGLSVATPPACPALSARLSSCRWACLATAPGPGRPGLQRCYQGGMACLAGNRFLGQETGRAS